MKNLILSVFAVILAILPVSISNAQVVVDNSPDQKIVGVEAALGEESGKMPVPPFEPVVWKIRKGENLTRIAERYNLSIQSILEPNEGGDCIKTKDKIFAGCEIIIPVYPLEQIEKYADDQKVLVENVERVRAEGEDKANFTVSLFVFAFLASVLLLLVTVAAFNALKKRMKKAEDEKTDLSSKLWVAEDKVKKMESFLPGNYIELQTRENGKIKAKLIKVRLGKNGELEVYVACPAEEHCLVNASENLKLENALSHVYKQHGTSQDLKPNGWTE